MSGLVLSRSDPSILARWWWSVDRALLTSFILLFAVGAALTLSATPPVSERLGLSAFALAGRQLSLVPLAMLGLVTVSFFPVRFLRRLAIVGLIPCLALLLATLMSGEEIKGATRWLRLFGFSLQPSEFAKPCFALVAAWLLAAGRGNVRHPASLAALGLYLVFALLLVLQPDIGQLAVLTAIFGAQFWLAGFSLLLVAGLLLLFLTAAGGAYLAFPHVADRVRNFLDASGGDRFQVEQSLAAFSNGGWFGAGVAGDSVKANLPDAHADFIFAVAGEEFGLIGAALILSLFAFASLRGFWRIADEQRGYVVLAAAGLLTQFTVQVLINVGSSLHMIPTKGITLPLVSYGGSSLLATALGLGALLALLRRPRSGDPQ